MGKLSPITLIKDQKAQIPPLERKDLSGRTVVVTGCNVGLGLEGKPAPLQWEIRDAHVYVCDCL